MHLAKHMFTVLATSGGLLTIAGTSNAQAVRGDVFAATESGNIYNITTGGDFTGATPVASVTGLGLEAHALCVRPDGTILVGTEDPSPVQHATDFKGAVYDVTSGNPVLFAGGNGSELQPVRALSCSAHQTQALAVIGGNPQADGTTASQERCAGLKDIHQGAVTCGNADPFTAGISIGPFGSFRTRLSPPLMYVPGAHVAHDHGRFSAYWGSALAPGAVVGYRGNALVAFGSELRIVHPGDEPNELSLFATVPGATKLMSREGSILVATGNSVIDATSGGDLTGAPAFATLPSRVTAIAYRTRCGDGVVQAPEQCDDGNAVDGDGCSEFCLSEIAQRGEMFVATQAGHVYNVTGGGDFSNATPVASVADLGLEAGGLCVRPDGTMLVGTSDPSVSSTSESARYYFGGGVFDVTTTAPKLARSLNYLPGVTQLVCHDSRAYVLSRQRDGWGLRCGGWAENVDIPGNTANCVSHPSGANPDYFVNLAMSLGPLGLATTSERRKLSSASGHRSIEVGGTQYWYRVYFDSFPDYLGGIVEHDGDVLVQFDGNLRVFEPGNDPAQTPVFASAAGYLGEMLSVEGNLYVTRGSDVVDATAGGDLSAVPPFATLPSNVTAIAFRTRCGDGVLQSHEACDDGNFLNGDGCSSYCKVETSGTGGGGAGGTGAGGGGAGGSGGSGGMVAGSGGSGAGGSGAGGSGAGGSGAGGSGGSGNAGTTTGSGGSGGSTNGSGGIGGMTSSSGSASGGIGGTPATGGATAAATGGGTDDIFVGGCAITEPTRPTPTTWPVLVFAAIAFSARRRRFHDAQCEPVLIEHRQCLSSAEES